MRLGGLGEVKSVVRLIPVFLSVAFVILSRVWLLSDVVPALRSSAPTVAAVDGVTAVTQPPTDIAPVITGTLARNRDSLPSRGVQKRRFVVTAYTKLDAGGEITYSGTKVTPWHTVAVDPSTIPLGYWVYIPYFDDAPNKGWFHAEDSGGAIKGNRIDVYMEDRQEALRFGVQELEVVVTATPPR